MKKKLIYLVCIAIFFHSNLSVNAGELNRAINGINQVDYELVGQEDELKTEEDEMETKVENQLEIKED